jgi:hypothetical protein
MSLYLLVHTKTHEEHLKVLEQVLERLHSHNLKINLDKCFFRSKEVSYLGFMLIQLASNLVKTNSKRFKMQNL